MSTTLCWSSPALLYLSTYTAHHLSVLKLWGLSISLFILGKQEKWKCKAYLWATNNLSLPCPHPGLTRCDPGAAEALAAPEISVPDWNRHTGSGRAMAGGLPNLLTHPASSEQAQRALQSLQTCPRGSCSKMLIIFVRAKRWCWFCIRRLQPHLILWTQEVLGKRPRGCIILFKLCKVGCGTWLLTQKPPQQDETMPETFRLQSQDSLSEACNWCSL